MAWRRLLCKMWGATPGFWALSRFAKRQPCPQGNPNLELRRFPFVTGWTWIGIYRVEWPGEALCKMGGATVRFPSWFFGGGKPKKRFVPGQSSHEQRQFACILKATIVLLALQLSYRVDILTSAVSCSIELSVHSSFPTGIKKHLK